MLISFPFWHEITLCADLVPVDLGCSPVGFGEMVTLLTASRSAAAFHAFTFPAQEVYSMHMLLNTQLSHLRGPRLRFSLVQLSPL